MSAATFAQLCQAKRAAAKSDDGEGKSYNAVAAATRKKMNICAVCKGKKRPAELEIIKMEEMTMATKRGICESCGQKGMTVSPNHGALMCSTCKTIHSHVRNRRETVLGAVKRMELVDQYVGELAGDLVQTTVESLAMERIEAAVGYDGKDGDGLIAAVETMAKSRLSVIASHRRDADMLLEIAEIMGVDCADLERLPDEARKLEEAHFALLEARANPQQPSMDVVRALGLPEGPTSWQTVELAAMQTAALLEEAEGEQPENQYELLRLRRLVKLPGSPLREIVDQVEHLIAALDAGSHVDADLVTANNRVEELETALDQIRDAFDGPLPQGVDLAAEVRRLVASHRSDLKYIQKIDAAIGGVNMPLDEAIRYLKDLAEQAPYAHPVAMDLRTSGRPAESYILDLALMALRGEVTGLDPDFLVVMREAV